MSVPRFSTKTFQYPCFFQQDLLHVTSLPPDHFSLFNSYLRIYSLQFKNADETTDGAKLGI